jgi:cytochrome c peroxidase
LFLLFGKGRGHGDLRQWVKAAGLVTADIVVACLLGQPGVSAAGQSAQPVKNRYIPVVDNERFATVHDRMIATKVWIMQRQKNLSRNEWHDGHDGAIKAFPLRGVQDTPRYIHDGRLLTLDDTVEYFNLMLNTKPTGQVKKDVVAFYSCFVATVT